MVVYRDCLRGALFKSVAEYISNCIVWVDYCCVHWPDSATHDGTVYGPATDSPYCPGVGQYWGTGGRLWPHVPVQRPCPNCGMVHWWVAYHVNGEYESYVMWPLPDPLNWCPAEGPVPVSDTIVAEESDLARFYNQVLQYIEHLDEFYRLPVPLREMIARHWYDDSGPVDFRPARPLGDHSYPPLRDAYYRWQARAVIDTARLTYKPGVSVNYPIAIAYRGRTYFYLARPPKRTAKTLAVRPLYCMPPELTPWRGSPTPLWPDGRWLTWPYRLHEQRGPTWRLSLEYVPDLREAVDRAFEEGAAL